MSERRKAKFEAEVLFRLEKAEKDIRDLREENEQRMREAKKRNDDCA